MREITATYRLLRRTLAPVDWRIFHALNHELAGHRTAQDVVRNFNSYAIFVLLIAAIALCAS